MISIKFTLVPCALENNVRSAPAGRSTLFVLVRPCRLIVLLSPVSLLSSPLLVPSVAERRD